jgi:hypothetical protein
MRPHGYTFFEKKFGLTLQTFGPALMIFFVSNPYILPRSHPKDPTMKTTTIVTFWPHDGSYGVKLVQGSSLVLAHGVGATKDAAILDAQRKAEQNRALVAQTIS